MVEQQSCLVDEDDVDHEPIGQYAVSLTPIQTFFDFSCLHWVEMHSRLAIQSFDKELQLYKMLDLHAEGEEDVDDDDDDTGDLLMG